MNLHEWWQTLLRDLRNTPWLEWLAIGTGVAEVLLARVNNVLLYPAGLISTGITIFVFFEAKLYAEAGLNFYYVVMSIYGWIYWLSKKDDTPVEISRTNRKEWLTATLIMVLGTGLLYVCLKHTDSTVPFLDSLVSATAWAGTWLLARRKVENWLLLNLSNIIAIPLLIYKHLPVYALLTAFLFIVAVQGYFHWLMIWRNSATSRLQINEKYPDVL